MTVPLHSTYLNSCYASILASERFRAAAQSTLKADTSVRLETSNGRQSPSKIASLIITFYTYICRTASSSLDQSKQYHLGDNNGYAKPSSSTYLPIMVFHVADSLYSVNEIFVCYVLSSPKKLIRGTHRCFFCRREADRVYPVVGNVLFEVCTLIFGSRKT